ncbi:hypothetical protein CEJ39_14280 [Rhodococcus pyridinivorans]|nr:hypothetical protein CEJ39_14280 [Rhodococcus pyridinivorans]
MTRHDPGKIVLDLATAFAIGGDCLADISQLRTHPEIFGAVASDPTVSRLISVLAVDADTALAAIDRARATARRHAWTAAGASAPPSTPSTKRIRWSSTSMPPKVTAHSEKEQAARRSREASFSICCARTCSIETKELFPGPWTSASPDRVGQSTVDAHRIHGLHTESEAAQSDT